MTIYVTWIGDGPEPIRLTDAATAALHREFAAPAHRIRLDGRPPDTFDVRRQQHSSRTILGWLTGHLPEGDDLYPSGTVTTRAVSCSS